MLTTESIVEAIREEAKKKYGDNWLPRLTRDYEKRVGADAGKRRSQIWAVFSGTSENPRCSTVLQLAQCVGIQAKLYREEEIKPN